MGNFYGSIYARGASDEQALDVLRDLAGSLDVSFYVRPTSRWLVMYPSDRAQDFAVSARIAEALDVPFVHVVPRA